MSGSPFNPLSHSTMRETEAYWKGVTDALWEVRTLWEHVPPKRRLDSFISHHTPDPMGENATRSPEDIAFYREHWDSPQIEEQFYEADEDWINHGGSL